MECRRFDREGLCQLQYLRGRNVYILSVFHCYVIAQQFAQSYLCCSDEPLPNYIAVLLPLVCQMCLLALRLVAHQTGDSSFKRFILVAGSVETDPTDGPVGRLIVVPAVAKSGLHTSPQLSCEVDTDCVVCLHGDLTFLQL